MRIVLLENEPGLLAATGELFASFGIPVEPCSKASSIDMSKPIDILVLDHYLNGKTGLQVMAEIRSLYPKCFVILMTGSDEHTVKSQYINAGANKCLDKGSGPDLMELMQVVRRLIDEDKLKQSLAQHKKVSKWVKLGCFLKEVWKGFKK